MPPGDAFEVSPARFFFELNGYVERNHRQWEQTRVITAYVCRALGAKITPRDVVRLKFDAPRIKVDPDEIRAWGDKIANLVGWKNIDKNG
jgi:hypothetical protein